MKSIFNHFSLFAIFFSLFTVNGSAQKLDLQNKERNKPYAFKLPETIVDSTYGVVLYEKYNPLNEDSVRYCGKNPCYGILEDYYTNDSLLHRGTYSEGKLQSYKNYYPNGILEREIRFVNIYSAKMKLYYPDGKPKSVIEYLNTNPIKWTDYFENGNIDYEEEYDRKYEYYVKRISYFENGKTKEEEILTKKGKLLYSYKLYHPNGQVKQEGEKRYLKGIGDYRKVGTWKHYKEDGSLEKEELF